jgi:hypothetical protein
MATKTTKTTETPRTRNRDWGFFGTCVSNGHADVEAAWDEAMAALTDSKGRFRLSPENARDLLDATWGRHLADQVVGMKIGKAIAGLAEDGWAKDARAFVRRYINPGLPALGTDTREEALAGIAQRVLSIPTLHARHSDDLDFHEVSVWALRVALDAAYEAGRSSAKR